MKKIHALNDRSWDNKRVLVCVFLQSVSEHLTFSKLKRCICCCSKTGDQQEDVVAHISPHVFYVAQGQRGGGQGGTGAVAALNSEDDVGHLHTGPESAEASGTKQRSRHDPLDTKL
jgi:hypothetical protein